ncbi:dystrotelin-like, partial [Megalobrama amblycephala]|uniref:dystrotelin-like n=1 Tax=Megalobrama amblycephala TaxID=75352 RepID=UPI0020143ED5
ILSHTYYVSIYLISDSLFQTPVHLVSLQDLRPVLNTLCSGEPMISLAQEDVQQLLEELFQSISHELPGQAVPEATDQTSRLLFKLFDREKTSVILLRSVEAALIALCGDTLSAKQRALFRLAESYSGNQESDGGSISRSALRVLLEDLSQVPAVVQENHVFGHAETAVSSCFNMRDLQRDKWLLEKEFQVWRVAAQSEHDSLEDKCTELKTMMEALNQNNQHLEDELDRVRHVRSSIRRAFNINLFELHSFNINLQLRVINTIARYKLTVLFFLQF